MNAAAKEKLNGDNIEDYIASVQCDSHIDSFLPYGIWQSSAFGPQSSFIGPQSGVAHIQSENNAFVLQEC